MDYAGYIEGTGQGRAASERVFARFCLRTYFSSARDIIEVGPGRGQFVEAAPDRVLAVDSEPVLVAKLIDRGLRAIEGDASDLPVDDASFDGYFACWLLEHLPDPIPAVSEALRVLRTGGVAVFIVPSEQSLMHGFYDDITHVRPFTAASFHQIALAARPSAYWHEHLAYTRGYRHLLRFTSESAVGRYLDLIHTRGRRVGIVNRTQLVLLLRK